MLPDEHRREVRRGLVEERVVQREFLWQLLFREGELREHGCVLQDVEQVPGPFRDLYLGGGCWWETEHVDLIAPLGMPSMAIGRRQ